MTQYEGMITDLRKLPPEMLAAAASYVQVPPLLSKEERKAILDATFGCMPGEEGEKFERAVREVSDRTDG